MASIFLMGRGEEPQVDMPMYEISFKVGKIFTCGRLTYGRSQLSWCE